MTWHNTLMLSGARLPLSPLLANHVLQCSLVLLSVCADPLSGWPGDKRCQWLGLWWQCRKALWDVSGGFLQHWIFTRLHRSIIESCALPCQARTLIMCVVVLFAACSTTCPA